MYKSRLQELCFEKSWPLPQYAAIKKGPDHIPQFRASVFINGEFFHSPISCGSLKEAQNQAAMAAFTHFSSLDSTHVSGSDTESSESLGKPHEALANDAKLAVSLSSLSVQEFQQDCVAYNNRSQELRKINDVKVNDAATSTKGKGNLTREIALDAPAETLAYLGDEEMVKTNKQKTPEARSFLLSNKVRVYSYVPDIANLPKGVTVLPISEDKWVVVSLDFPNEKGKIAA